MAQSKFRTVRISILMMILAIVALYSFEQKRVSTSWFKTVEIVVYPINVNDNPAVEKYINALSDKNFRMIDQFMVKQAARYKIILSKPTKTRLGQQMNILPPSPPESGAGVFSIITWSVKFRFWAWKNTPDDQSNFRRARMFVLYHESVEGKRLPHSYGLNKGLLGYVNAFASIDQQSQNNIVIAHEFLHTVGASDKYDLNGEPVFPVGFASPDLTNSYAQKKAEIMAGRIPVSPTESKMPKSLKNCVIGKETSLEINWIKI